MKPALYLRCLLAAFVLLTSCLPKSNNEDIKWQDVTSEKFTIKLPDYMSSATNLNDEAIIQYQNIIKGIFMIVIQEDVDAFNAAIEEYLPGEYTSDLEGYSSLIFDQFSGAVEINEKSEVKDFSIGKMNGKLLEANGTVEGTRIYYHYGIIKSESRYYQILSWTTVSRKKRFHDIMEKILMSFQEKEVGEEVVGSEDVSM